VAELHMDPQCSPRPSNWIKEGLFLREGEETVKGGERE